MDYIEAGGMMGSYNPSEGTSRLFVVELRFHSLYLVFELSKSKI